MHVIFPTKTPSKCWEARGKEKTKERMINEDKQKKSKSE